MSKSVAVDFLLPQEAARILGVSPKTVTRWAAAGWLDHTTTLGGHRRYLRGQIEELAARMRSGELGPVAAQPEVGTTSG